MKTYKEIIKQAGIYQDVYGSMSNPLNAVANPIAVISGISSNPDKVDDDTGLGSTFLPGAGLHRAIRKEKRAERDYAGKKQMSKTVSHRFGPMTAAIVSVLGGQLLGAGVGAGIGALKGGKEGANTGVGIGGAIGSVAGAATVAIAQLIAKLRAAHKPTWTKEQMSDYVNEGSAAANYFVPGLGSYRKYKTIGRINRDEHLRLEEGRGYESQGTKKRKAKKAQKEARKEQRKARRQQKKAKKGMDKEAYLKMMQIGLDKQAKSEIKYTPTLMQSNQVKAKVAQLIARDPQLKALFKRVRRESRYDSYIGDRMARAYKRDLIGAHPSLKAKEFAAAAVLQEASNKKRALEEDAVKASILGL